MRSYEKHATKEQFIPTERTLGFWGATGIGVGAIVGGGILAMAGAAFSATGPSALVAFTLNGLVAIITALSFAEMSAAFPESGGAYNFSKKVLSIQAAFMVGWVVWFASIVAAVLYALGFAEFAVLGIEQIWKILPGKPCLPIPHRYMVTGLAVISTIIYTVSLIRKQTGGGQWATVGKVIVFAVIILAGLWVLSRQPLGLNLAKMKPFFSNGPIGLFQAMGYTFIALQGFDIIAAVAGEVKNPAKTLPKAMLCSLAVALAVYLPLLFVVSTVGVADGQTIAGLSAQNPETIVADAAGRFLGPFGYWMVITAAVLAMLSALHANLLAASRVARAMADDRTLPKFLGVQRQAGGTPVNAILAGCVTVVIILMVIPNVAAAGAAAGLIFLISFALAHWTNILFRIRAGDTPLPFRTPYFPALPVTGGAACVALAVFQGYSVPAAGVIAIVWLGFGSILYLSIFARRARVVDAAYEAGDPARVQLRGRNPLILVPIANPANAQSLVAIANSMAPQVVGKVLLLFVVKQPENWKPGIFPPQLVEAQAALKESLTASFSSGLAPEALTTVAKEPWTEIIRVSGVYRCESLLLGFSNLTTTDIHETLENIISAVRSDVVVLRAKQGWRLEAAKNVLVPIGGNTVHNRLRARLLNSLSRIDDRRITYLRVLPSAASDAILRKAEVDLQMLCDDESFGQAQTRVIRSDDPGRVILEGAAENDLVILGLQKTGRRKVFGEIVLQFARQTDCALIVISQK